jgi:hypothetical protein
MAWTNFKQDYISVNKNRLLYDEMIKDNELKIIQDLTRTTTDINKNERLRK